MATNDECISTATQGGRTRAGLEEKLLALAASKAPCAVHLRANKLAAYKVVAGVMAAAQRSGVVHIGVVGNELM